MRLIYFIFCLFNLASYGVGLVNTPLSGIGSNSIIPRGKGPMSGPATNHVITAPVLIRTMTNTSSAGVSAITLSGFNASGGNYLVIAIGTSTAANRTVSSVTTGTGAQTATNIVTANYNGTLTGKIALYGIVNPTTGDIVVTMSGATFDISVTALLFNNVSGSGTSGSGNAGSDFSSTARTSTSNGLTTLGTDLVVDCLCYNATIGNPTQGGSQTLIAETSGTGTLAFLANSTQPGITGTTTMTWTFASQVVSWAGVVLNGM